MVDDVHVVEDGLDGDQVVRLRQVQLEHHAVVVGRLRVRDLRRR